MVPVWTPGWGGPAAACCTPSDGSKAYRLWVGSHSGRRGPGFVSHKQWPTVEPCYGAHSRGSALVRVTSAGIACCVACASLLGTQSVEPSADLAGKSGCHTVSPRCLPPPSGPAAVPLRGSGRETGQAPPRHGGFSLPCPVPWVSEPTLGVALPIPARGPFRLWPRAAYARGPALCVFVPEEDLPHARVRTPFVQATFL